MRFSRRSRRSSSCSSVVRPSLRCPSSSSACFTQSRSVSPVKPSSRAICARGLPLVRASRIASARNSGWIRRDRLCLLRHANTSSGASPPRLQVSTKAGQLHSSPTVSNSRYSRHVQRSPRMGCKETSTRDGDATDGGFTSAFSRAPLAETPRRPHTPGSQGHPLAPTSAPRPLSRRVKSSVRPTSRGSVP